jgi:hypothetical protein
MTSLNRQGEHNQPIRVLQQLLDSTVADEVADRLEVASDSYLRTITTCGNHQEFNAELSRFLQHMNLHGLRPPRTLTAREALAEAIHLLETYHSGTGASGYFAAFLDATDTPGGGLEAVLWHIAETMKEQENRKHTDWLFSSLVNPTDRDAQRDIVRGLIEEFRMHLPEELQAINPEHFAMYYRDVLEMILASFRLSKHISVGIGEFDDS